tara:strand:- start:7079 stop:7567 length:489 start_codon:yes stop_codon:yes gene_type:complete
MVRKEKMHKKKFIIFSIIFISFLLDLITKNYAINNLIINHSVSINNYLNFTLAFNYGAAFSFLSDAGGWQRWFFIIFSLIVITIITFFIIFDKETEYIAFSFVLGGALGNLYDRLLLGYVIDFIEIHYNNFYWPIFNIADISISIGIILLLYSLLIKKNKTI